MNKERLKELFELEEQLCINEGDRFHNSENGKKYYAEAFDCTMKELEGNAKKYIYDLMERNDNYDNKDIVHEKATELYDKFYHLSYKYHTSSGIKETRNISKQTAKDLALIVIDEILNEPKMMYSGGGTNDPHYKFWLNVKNEIKR